MRTKTGSDDRQHDRHGVDENEPLGGADRPGRIENAAAAAQDKGSPDRGPAAAKPPERAGPVAASATLGATVVEAIRR